MLFVELNQSIQQVSEFGKKQNENTRISLEHVVRPLQLSASKDIAPGQVHQAIDMFFRSRDATAYRRERAAVLKRIEVLRKQINLNVFDSLINELFDKVGREIIMQESHIRTELLEMRSDLDAFKVYAINIHKHGNSVKKAYLSKRIELKEQAADNNTLDSRIYDTEREISKLANEIINDNTLSRNEAVFSATNSIKNLKSTLEREKKIIVHKSGILNKVEQEKNELRNSFEKFDQISNNINRIMTIIQNNSCNQNLLKRKQDITDKFESEFKVVLDECVKCDVLDNQNKDWTIDALAQHLEHRTNVFLLRKEAIKMEKARTIEMRMEKEANLQQKRNEFEQEENQRACHLQNLDQLKQALQDDIGKLRDKMICNEKTMQQESIDFVQRIDQLKQKYEQEKSLCEQLKLELIKVCEQDIQEMENAELNKKQYQDEEKIILSKMMEINNLQNEFKLNQINLEQSKIKSNLPALMDALNKHINAIHDYKERIIREKEAKANEIREQEARRIEQELKEEQERQAQMMMMIADEQPEEPNDQKSTDHLSDTTVLASDHSNPENDQENQTHEPVVNNHVVEIVCPLQSKMDENMPMIKLTNVKRPRPLAEKQIINSETPLKKSRIKTPHKQMTPTKPEVVKTPLSTSSKRSSLKATPRKPNSILETYTTMMKKLNSGKLAMTPGRTFQNKHSRNYSSDEEFN